MAIGYGAAAVGDLALLLALFAFDGERTRSGGESVAFAGVSSFCLVTPLLFLAYIVLGADVPLPQTVAVAPATAVKAGSPWVIFGTWAIATLILFAVDRFRMSSREKVGLAEAGLAAPGPMKPMVVTSPAASYRPAPIRVEPVQPAPAATYVAPAPVAPPPAMAQDFEATTVSASAIQPVVASAPPDVTAIPPGREAVIYLNLVGEGLNVLRTVRAENLGRDYFRIADIMPEGEQWEFTPGQVVRCRKKSLSNGKHMVAYEEAPRAQ